MKPGRYTVWFCDVDPNNSNSLCGAVAAETIEIAARHFGRPVDAIYSYAGIYFDVAVGNFEAVIEILPIYYSLSGKAECA